MALSSKVLAAITTLLLIMCALIITGLEDESLWGDEGWSVRFTDGESPRSATLAVAEDRHPPLYFVGLWGWRQVVGDDEIALRYLGVFASLLSAAFIFRLGQHLFGTATGLAGLLFFALLDKQVVFSQEVRHYPWLITWTAASFWALLRWKRKPSPGSNLFYGATVIGGLYTHSFMFVILAIQALYAAVTTRPVRRLGKLVTLWILAGIAFAPWGLVFVYQYQIHGGLRHDFPFTREIVDILVTDFLGRPMPLFAALLLVGIIAPLMKRSSREAILLPIMGLVFPLALIVGLPQVSSEFKLLTDRNLSIIIPALALLIGVGIMTVPRYPRYGLVAFLLVFGVLTTDANAHNPPWRPISRYVAAHQIDDQPIILDVGGADAALSYHLRQEAGDVPQISILELRDDPQTDVLTALRFEKLDGVEGFWYIQWNDDPSLHEAFTGWGYERTAVAQDVHLGAPIYLHRYDRGYATFDAVLWLLGVEIPEGDVGDRPTIGLWWRTSTALDVDHTLAISIEDVFGDKQEAFMEMIPSSGWEPNNLYFVALTFDLPENPEVGNFPLRLRVLRPDGSTLMSVRNRWASDVAWVDENTGELRIGVLRIY